MSVRPTGVLAAGASLRALLGLPPGPPESITGVTLDSRAVLPGDLYAALPGFTTHGARFAQMAQQAGAAAILTDPAGAALIAGAGPIDVRVLVVADPRGQLGAVADWLYGHPSRSMRITGITGTNGKTTTSFLLDAALRTGGVTGVIGTVAAQVGDEVLPAVRTTPEAPDLHALLAVMRQRGAWAVTMEVSSHALVLGRVDGVDFDLGLFTNLSQDHLDFHGDMDSYFEAKAGLFMPGRCTAALVCTDDEWGRAMLDRARAAGLPSMTYAIDGPADWTARHLRASGSGASTFEAHGPDGLVVAAGVGLPGRFNVANALAALAAAVHLGIDAGTAAEAIRTCPGVPGRMERIIGPGGLLALVDYAHTPDAVVRAIAAAREGREGRLIVVLGCGGDRDREKRPMMGRVAARDADVLVVTDDNPRSEPPEQIRAEMLAGVRAVAPKSRAEVHEQGDRRAAIALAIGLAAPGDVVLVLGKGHEQGQEAAGVLTPFDDRIEVRRAMEGAA